VAYIRAEASPNEVLQEPANTQARPYVNTCA
jgi:hypothetical protein